MFDRTLLLGYSTTCPLKCDYCANNMHKPSVQARKSIIDRVGAAGYIEKVGEIIDYWSPMTINFFGPGETTHVPWFVDLAQAVYREGNHIVIQTNMLPRKNLFRFIDSVDPEGVTVAASYHVGVLDAHRRAGVFGGIVDALAKSAKVHVTVPLAPKALAAPNLATDLAAFREAGASLYPIELGHVLDGKRYPASYTDAERKQVKSLMRQFGTERPVPTDTALLKYVTPNLHLKGRSCYARSMAHVGLDGGMFPCSAAPLDPRYLGHLIDGFDLEALFSSEPWACPFDECRCKPIGLRYCLKPAGVTIEEYYADYYDGVAAAFRSC